MRWVSGRAVVGLVAAVSVITAGQASAASLVPVGNTAVLPKGATVLGTYTSTVPLRVTVELKPQNPVALAAYATAVSTPRNPLYGRFLTVGQFADRFGATPAAIAAVEAAMRADGLQVVGVPADRLSVQVSGPTNTVAQAFATSLTKVSFAGHTGFANATPPAVPASISPSVQGIIGLDNVVHDQPAGLIPARKLARSSGSPAQSLPTGGAQPCAETTALSGTNVGYTLDQFAAMYGLNGIYGAGDLGQGETIGLVEEQATQLSDVTHFQGCYTLNGASLNQRVSFEQVGQGVGTYNPGSPDGSVNDDSEAALDLDVVLGLAPKADVIVYQEAYNIATAPSDILQAMVSENKAKVLSSSWGVCEKLTPQSVINAENTLLQEAAVQGQSFFGSSGDSGSTACYQATGNDYTLSVIDPGAQPFATGVGGTYLGMSNGTLPGNGTYPGEDVWNDGLPGGLLGFDYLSGSGGGVSDQWAMPSYQANSVDALGVIGTDSSNSCNNSLCREVPDVSADADPNSAYIVYANGGLGGGGWEAFGGTSAASPLWAAFTTLANGSSTCRGLTVGFVNPALYQIAGNAFSSNFHDITASDASPFTGQASNNTLYQYPNLNPKGLYPLANGYDMATGLGSPITNILGNSLCSVRSPAYTVSVANPGNQVSVIGGAVTLKINGSDSGNAALTYSASGLPASLAINPSTGVISGTVSTVGTSTVTVAANDEYTNAGSTQFKWSVIEPGRPSASGGRSGGRPGSRPSASGGSLGNLTRRPTLRVSLRAGLNAPAVRTVGISLPRGITFAKSRKSLAKGISVTLGGHRVRYTRRVSGRRITLRFVVPVRSASIVITKPAIIVSKSLANKYKHNKIKKLNIGVRVTDAAGTATSFKLVLRA